MVTHCRNAALLSAVLLTSLAMPVRAQKSDGPMITDRPDQTESSVTVSPGAMQLEIGWTYTRDDETGFERRSHALPQALVRVGVVPRLEARFGFAGWIRDEVTGAAPPVTSEGIGDLDLGFKYQIVDGGGTSPDVAVLTAVSIPTGEDQVGAFIQSFGTFALDSDGSSARSVDGGFTWVSAITCSLILPVAWG